MQRYILTGAPGSGKISILRALQSRGYDVVEEAASAVIAAEQAHGDDEPWARPAFIDKIVGLQRLRQVGSIAAHCDPQIFDRSPVCTLALSVYLRYPVSAALSAEIGRISRESIYSRRVFFVRDIGFVKPTAARRITLQEAREFERVHAESYRALGYELVGIPRGDVADRADVIAAYVASWSREPGLAARHTRGPDPSGYGKLV